MLCVEQRVHNAPPGSQLVIIAFLMPTKLPLRATCRSHSLHIGPVHGLRRGGDAARYGILSGKGGGVELEAGSQVCASGVHAIERVGFCKPALPTSILQRTRHFHVAVVRQQARPAPPSLGPHPVRGACHRPQGRGGLHLRPLLHPAPPRETSQGHGGMVAGPLLHSDHSLDVFFFLQ